VSSKEFLAWLFQQCTWREIHKLTRIVEHVTANVSKFVLWMLERRVALTHKRDVVNQSCRFLGNAFMSIATDDWCISIILWDLQNLTILSFKLTLSLELRHSPAVAEFQFCTCPLPRRKFDPSNFFHITFNQVPVVVFCTPSLTAGHETQESIMNSFHLNHQSIALGVLFLLNTVQTQAQATGEGNPPFETSSNAGPTITLTDFTAPSGSKPRPTTLLCILNL